MLQPQIVQGLGFAAAGERVLERVRSRGGELLRQLLGEELGDPAPHLAEDGDEPLRGRRADAGVRSLRGAEVIAKPQDGECEVRLRPVDVGGQLPEPALRVQQPASSMVIVAVGS